MKVLLLMALPCPDSELCCVLLLKTVGLVLLALRECSVVHTNLCLSMCSSSFKNILICCAQLYPVPYIWIVQWIIQCTCLLSQFL